LFFILENEVRRKCAQIGGRKEEKEEKCNCKEVIPTIGRKIAW